MKMTSFLRVWMTKSLKPFEFLNDYDELLDFENAEPLGLYVHIPFCRSLCSFCPYCKVIYDKTLAQRYKVALLKEIEMVGSQLTKPKAITSLYFGGGTPALMIDDLNEIITTLKKYFIIAEGVGVEMHPNDVSDENLSKFKNAGVTMISVGIQSFNAQCIYSLGRKEVDHARIFEAIKNAKFETVDMDLIFAIPGQTAEILLKDIETAFENGATQVSTYPFIDFTFANNRYKPLPEENKKMLLTEISRFCKQNGYKRTSVWTFAKENTEKYSSITRDNFLGFGVSATTLLKNQFKLNTFSIEEYVKRTEQGHLPTSLTLRFSYRQRMTYYLFWSAYSMRISPKGFKKFFGKSLNKLFGPELLICRMLGFLERDGESYYLSERGAYYYHYIEQAYTTAYIDKMWNISRVTPFPDKIVLK
jgi:oxygen-independent coproporphyrinogen-3 oxidase